MPNGNKFSVDYDGSGNVLSIIGKEGNGEKTIHTYNKQNYLVKVKSENGNDIVIEEYAYDWEDNRIQKTTNKVFITRYMVNINVLRAQVLAELDSKNNVVATYVYGQEIISQIRAGKTLYYGFDGLGNVRMLFDQTGAIIDTYTYDAFGILTHKTGITENNYLFSGQQFDTRETLIATAEGNRPIVEIQVGDYVWAENIETGEKALKRVTEVFEKETTTLVHVTVNGETINTTETHLFYVENKGWTEAVELAIGDTLRLLDGQIAQVEDRIF